MGRGRKPKMDAKAREARLLGPEFCSLVDGSSEEQLRKMLEQLPLDRINLQERQKGDPDLKDLKERMKTASQPYREGFKRIDLKSGWIRSRLQAMGKPVGDDSEQPTKELPKDAFDKLGGKKEDAIEGRATEPKESPKEKVGKKTEKAIKEFTETLGKAPAVKPQDLPGMRAESASPTQAKLQN